MSFVEIPVKRIVLRLPPLVAKEQIAARVTLILRDRQTSEIRLDVSVRAERACVGLRDACRLGPAKNRGAVDAGG